MSIRDRPTPNASPKERIRRRIRKGAVAGALCGAVHLAGQALALGCLGPRVRPGALSLMNAAIAAALSGVAIAAVALVQGFFDDFANEIAEAAARGFNDAVAEIAGVPRGQREPVPTSMPERGSSPRPDPISRPASAVQA